MAPVGERIRQLRKQNNFSQKQLAKLLNVSNSTICNYETGVSKPDLSILVQLATIFNVSIDYLMDYNPGSQIKNPTIEIPILRMISKKSPLFNKQNILGYLKIPIAHPEGKNFFAIQVKDNSMTNCRIFKDDLAIVSVTNTIEDGKCGLYYVPSENSWIIRRCYRSNDLLVLIAQCSSDKYKACVCRPGSNQYILFGEVIGTICNFM